MANIYDQNVKLQAIADAITNQSITITTGQDLLDALADIANAMQPAAANISYDNTNSGLQAVNVQQAVDENADNILTLNSSINTIENRRWTFLTYIQANGTYTVPDLSQYKEYQIRAFLTHIRLTLLYDDIANFTTIFPEWSSGTIDAYCKIQKTNNTTLTVSDSTIATISHGAFFYVYAK